MVQVDIVVQTMIKLGVNLLDQVVHLVRTISDVVMRVTGGEQLTINVGSGGSAGTGLVIYSGNSGAGGTTSIIR